VAEGGDSKDSPGVWWFDVTGQAAPRKIESPGATGLLKAPPKGLRQLALSPDGARLAGASGDGVLVIWKVASGAVESVRLLAPDLVQTVAFTPEGALLASAKSFSLQISTSGGKASVEVSNAHGSVLLEPTGTEHGTAATSSRLIIENAAWHPAGYVLIYATEVKGTPPNHLLKLLDRSAVLAGGVIGKSPEVPVESGPLYSSFELTGDGRFALQATDKGLFLWSIDVGAVGASASIAAPAVSEPEVERPTASTSSVVVGTIRLGKPWPAKFKGEKLDYFMEQIHSLKPVCGSGFAKFNDLPAKAATEARARGYGEGDYVDMFECEGRLEIVPALTLTTESGSGATEAQTSTCACVDHVAVQIDDASPIQLSCSERKEVPSPTRQVSASAQIKVSRGTLTLTRKKDFVGGGQIVVRCGN
jgi:hypothetical protein